MAIPLKLQREEVVRALTDLWIDLMEGDDTVTLKVSQDTISLISRGEDMVRGDYNRVGAWNRAIASLRNRMNLASHDLNQVRPVLATGITELNAAIEKPLLWD